MATSSSAAILRPWLAGAAVALLGMAGSALLARGQADSARQIEQARFAQAAGSMTEALARRIDMYSEIAFGLRGLFVVEPGLGRREFFEAVGHLDVERRYPEIRNLAFTRYVAAGDRPAFERRVRSDTSVDPGGYPDFAIHPAGERSEYFVADYLWPVDGNQGILGLDISTQPANLASMRHSMRTGEPVASAPFDLLQVATDRVGFVIRVPVFRPAAPGTTASPAAFLGSVAVTLRMHDLLEQLRREGRLNAVHVAITDQGSALPDMPGASGRMLASTLPAGLASGQQAFARDLQVYTRRWRLEFQPAVPFLSDSEREAPLWIGLGGGLISVLLAVLVAMLVRGRMAALQRVESSREALLDSEGRWKFAIEGAGDGLWDRDLRSGKVFFSPRWKEMLGLSDEDVGEDLDEWSRRVHPDDLPLADAAMQAHLRGATPLYTSEHRVACKNGSWKWVLARGKVVQRGADGSPLRMIGTVSDISERKLSAQMLQASLRDKDALLKEVHHRVKNNLQVMTSLLRLEGRRAQQDQTRNTLADMQGRIMSMALLHESLYRSGTVASVDLADYLRKLVDAVAGTQSLPADRVQVHCRLAPLQMAMEQALPCGLLVNELVSNALKHAFTDGREGALTVALQPAGSGGMWRLSVADDGVGLPADFRQRQDATMGLQLVGQLSEQIGGTLDIRSGHGRGAVFVLEFRVDLPAPLVMPE